LAIVLSTTILPHIASWLPRNTFVETVLIQSFLA